MITAEATDTAAYALRLGDDALVAAQRLIEWSARAPTIEEDIALANLALDLLGQARGLLTLAGEREGRGRDEDALAYLRDEREYANALLVELPRGDFAHTVLRQLLLATYQHELYRQLAGSTDEQLAGIAVKAVKEVAYHVEHCAQWVIRLGDGTEESHRRCVDALDQLWPYAAELFESDALAQRIAAARVGVDPATLRPAWDARIDAVLERATLERPETTWQPTGGRAGRHTEAMGFLLAELQSLHRAHPGARW